MPPKSVTYHILGQHLAGEAVVGYAVGPDTPILLPPKLILRGGAVVRNVTSVAAPKLVLYGKPGIVVGKPFGTPPVGAPKLLLRGVITVTSGFAPGPRDVLSPRLMLLPGGSTLSISSTFVTGEPSLYLLGRKAVGKESGMVPSRPVDWILWPTDNEAVTLPPTVEEDWLLVPTTEREM